MSIKILSADEIKQKKNSYDIPPVLFANPKNLYQRRAKRLRELAKDHPLADYLLFAADVVESQLSVFEKNPLEKQSFDNLNEIEPLNAQAFGLNISKKFCIALNQKRMNRLLLPLKILKKPLIKSLKKWLLIF